MPQLKNDLKARVEESRTALHPNSENPDAHADEKVHRKRHIGGHFDEEVYRQMKHLGVETDMTMQSMLTEAINALFRLHDKPPIA